MFGLRKRLKLLDTCYAQLAKRVYELEHPREPLVLKHTRRQRVYQGPRCGAATIASEYHPSRPCGAHVKGAGERCRFHAIAPIANGKLDTATEGDY